MNKLSEKTRKALSADSAKPDPMAARMALLSYIADNGPLKMTEMMCEGLASVSSRVAWLKDMGLINSATSGTRGVLYSVSLTGMRAIRPTSGVVVPPATRTPKAWNPHDADLAWKPTRQGACDAFEICSMGIGS